MSSIILASDNRWQWDDTNNTDLPIGTSTLVDEQQDYEITGATFLDVLRVEVLDIAGKYQLLKPIDQAEVKNQSLSEFQKTAGMPRFYDKSGDSILLYPKPSSSQVTVTAGLKVYYQRGASLFVSSDTTKVPGFASPFHRMLSMGAAMDYAIANNISQNKIQMLQNQMNNLEAKMIEFYQRRNRDEKLSMSVARERYAPSDVSIY